MALSGSSTLADAKAQYLASLRYAAEGSASKCNDFIEACGALLLLLPRRTRHGRGMEVEMDPALVAEQMRQAEQWRATTGSTGGAVRHASFNNFRS